MKHFFIFFFLLSAMVTMAQEKETITQNQADQVGKKTMDDLKIEPHAKWFNTSYLEYQLDNKTVGKIRKKIGDIHIKIFMSVWCHDSHREIPRLYKILETIDFDFQKLELVALNRAKKTPDNLQEGYHILRTPTIIFYKNNKELGRFVEKPRKSLEKDILTILSGKKYRHSYADKYN